MGILDDAIKEHLELKRQHGAGEPELKQLEDEAFGAGERPGGEGSAPDALAEAPPRRSPRAEIADLQEAPPPEPKESAEEPAEPAEEESPAMEHEAVREPQPPPEATPPPEPEAREPEPETPTGPTTEEREAIAEQPTEMYDVEEGLEEARLAPVDPLAGLDEDAEAGEAGGADTEQVGEVEDEYEEDDDFWDEKRLSDELDQALEAPSEVEEDAATELYEDAAVEGEPAEEEPPASQSDEDVLEETPDFLEEAPEDDQLWFEQKPPKDFDFDD
jgi:hypothetical protein